MKIFLIIFFGLIFSKNFAQRNYANQSVLATGSWYKIGIEKSGIYKIDLPFLASLGINTTNIQSSTIRLYGNTGKMIGEDCNSFKYDDLQENSIEIFDGGDGIFNNSDYFIFYAEGTDYWLKDSINKRFTHQKNLYSNVAFYYITINGNGKRINNAINPSTNNINVTTYNDHYFFEENKINFLNSGKEWLGNEFSILPGHSLTKSINININNYLPNSPIYLKSDVVARGGISTNYNIIANNNTVQQIQLNPVSGGVLDRFCTQQSTTSNYTSNQEMQNISINYNPNNTNAQGWLNYIELNTTCKLSMQNQSQLMFRDWNSIGLGNISKYLISNITNNLEVWDITNVTEPQKQSGIFTNNNFSFNQNSNSLKEFIAFDNSNFLIPQNKGVISNQNLHNSSPTHFLIITTNSLVNEAQRLADFHIANDHIIVKVVTENQIYNEFGSGIPDVTAIRDFIKMYYDKYKTNTIQLQNVLIFGDASFDYLNTLNNNIINIPSWESKESFDPIQSYVTDDFFAYLDDFEDINNLTLTNNLDIGIGRIPAKNITDAKNIVDKIIEYYKPQSMGAWRNQVTLVADDEDGNLHLNDAEYLSNTVNTTANQFIQDKIYLDAFNQVSGSGGSRYPAVNNYINNKINDGTLIFNYSGHGGNNRLAEEDILDIDMVNIWHNSNKLPLFITATCDFAPYDDPTISSLGESLILKQKIGAIALMTTTRVVFANSNKIMNNNFLQFAFQRNANGKYNNLGEINKLAKNYTINNSGDIANIRKFTLLGDPALTIALPQYFVNTTKINDKIYNSNVDTIKSNSNIKIEGNITDFNQNLISNFNGKIAIIIYDKKQSINTLANDPSSIITSFETNGNILFKGNALVQNGVFKINFIAPKDLQINNGFGLINYYAQNDSTDANGTNKIMVGGTTTNNNIDNIGPNIKAYINDTKFVNGSITNQNVSLLVFLKDSSGINLSNIGIGHEISAVLDNDIRNTIILNNYYEADINTFKSGKIKFDLPKLSIGYHSIIIKAWDVFNNSSSYELQFYVVDDNNLEIRNVLNYPNPFTTNTTFWFEHNKPNENLKVNVVIYTITGKIVKQINTIINTISNRSCEIKWDGKDDYGNKVARGTYIYELSITNSSNKKQIKKEKLVKL